MANTVTPAVYNGENVTISALDSAWSGQSYVGAGKKILTHNILISGWSAGNYIKIYDGTTAGAFITLTSLDGSPMCIPMRGRPFAPYIDYANSSIAAGTHVVVQYDVRG